MATWKKIIVSGSTANLAALQVDNLTSGSVVIGGGTAGTLSTTAINGTGNIVATTGASGLVHSGSFSGSFQGNFVGTTNLPDLTQGTGITAFTYDGAAAATVAVSGASTLSTNNINKWTGTAFANSSLTDTGTVISGVSSIQLSGAASSLTGSFTGSFSGNGAGLTGVTATAVFPTSQITDIASASKFFISQSTGQEYITYGNLLTDLAGTNLAVEGTDSLALATTITGLTSVTSTGFTGSLQGTSSWASNAVSASLAATASNIFPAISGNVDNRVLTATGGGTIEGENNLQFNGTTLTVTGNAVITNNLTVQGTASFQNTTNLEVADRFVLFASGSNTTGDGGIVVQQGTQNVGELYGYDSGTTRWGFTSSFNASNATFTPAAYITTTETGTPAPSTAPIYGGAGNGAGNIYVTNGGDIYIYA